MLISSRGVWHTDSEIERLKQSAFERSSSTQLGNVE